MAWLEKWSVDKIKPPADPKHEYTELGFIYSYKAPYGKNLRPKLDGNPEGQKIADDTGEVNIAMAATPPLQNPSIVRTSEGIQVEFDKDGNMVCPACHVVNTPDRTSCRGCGRLFIVEKDDSPAAEEPVMEYDTRKPNEVDKTIPVPVTINDEGRYICPVCGRSNKPNRLKCFNCGQLFDIGKETNDAQS